MDQPGGLQENSPTESEPARQCIDEKSIRRALAKVLGGEAPRDLLDADRVDQIVRLSGDQTDLAPRRIAATIVRETWVDSPVSRNHREFLQNCIEHPPPNSTLPIWISRNSRLAVPVLLGQVARRNLNLGASLAVIDQPEVDRLKTALDRSLAGDERDMSRLEGELDKLFLSPKQAATLMRKRQRSFGSIFRGRRRWFGFSAALVGLFLAGLTGGVFLGRITSHPETIVSEIPSSNADRSVTDIAGREDKDFLPYAIPDRVPIVSSAAAELTPQLNVVSDNPRWQDETHFLQLWNPAVDPASSGYTRGLVAAKPGDRIKMRFIVENSGAVALEGVAARVRQDRSGTGESAMLSVIVNAIGVNEVTAGVPIRCTEPCSLTQGSDTEAVAYDQLGNKLYSTRGPDNSAAFATQTTLGSVEPNGVLLPGAGGSVYIEYEISVKSTS